MMTINQPTQPELTVRITSYPESNGKRNWTALFIRKIPFGGLIGSGGGIVIAQGECWNRVAYEAERARFLLGERLTEPRILDYGDDIETPDQWKGEQRTHPVPIPCPSEVPPESKEDEYVTVPVLNGFRTDREIGTLRVRKDSLPADPTFVFSIGARGDWPLSQDIPFKEVNGPYELFCVSPVSNADYAAYLRQVGVIPDFPPNKILVDDPKATLTMRPYQSEDGGMRGWFVTLPELYCDIEWTSEDGSWSCFFRDKSSRGLPFKEAYGEYKSATVDSNQKEPS